MAKGKKTSSEKIVEVITAKITNPDKSLRDISKETNLSHSTIWDILQNNMEEVITSSDKARDLIDVNISIINEWKRIIESEIMKLWKWEWNVKINSLNDIKTLSATLEDAFKQNQLIQQKPTEIVNWDYKNLTTEQLLELKNKWNDWQE